MRQTVVAYYRVSTARQSRSGLGLEAQRAAVEAYAASAGATIVAEFTEIESGKRSDRQELAKALQTCRIHRAVLVIAKLDRLARNAAFLLSLRDAGIEFVAADMPSANRMTVGIMAVVAEEEARAISARTKAALCAAKARGVVLGGDRGGLTDDVRAKGRERSAAVRSSAADKRAGDLRSVLAEIEASGAKSLRAVATALNERGIPSARGVRWSAQTVSELRDRLGV